MKKLNRDLIRKLIYETLLLEEDSDSVPEFVPKLKELLKNPRASYTNEQGETVTYSKVTRYRGKGDPNKNIKLVQNFLKSLGLYKGEIDGRAATGRVNEDHWTKVFMKFQSDNGLKPDGNLGPKTAKKMSEVLAQNNDFKKESQPSQSKAREAEAEARKKEQEELESSPEGEVLDLTPKIELAREAIADLVHKQRHSREKKTREKYKQSASAKPAFGRIINSALNFAKYDNLKKYYEISAYLRGWAGTGAGALNPFNTLVIDFKPKQKYAGNLDAKSYHYNIGSKSSYKFTKVTVPEVMKESYGLSRGNLYRKRYRRY